MQIAYGHALIKPFRLRLAGITWSWPCQLFFILLLSPIPAFPQTSGGQGFAKSHEPVACLSPEKEKEIREELIQSRKVLVEKGILPAQPDRSATTIFDWPLAPHNGLDDYGIHGISNFVDQDADFPGQILDYNCGARTYDLSSGYNHAGTDMYTWPFTWYKMEHEQVKVIAAADGVIVLKSDGHFDKSCGFNNNNWNAVFVEHADGSVAWYGHLKNGSLISKDVGETVTTGEYLGIVGSSGSSTGPHLHFEIHDQDGNLIDPYSGACNNLNTQSWWMNQRPYFDSGLNTLMTHDNPPVFPACPEIETIHEQNQFCGNALVYFAGYYRDQLIGQLVEYTVLRPNGTVYQQWTQTFVDNYSSSWWYWSWFLPVNPLTGRWSFQISYLGEIYEKGFDVLGQSTLTALGPTQFCEGESVMLSAPVGEYGFTYQWRKNGVDIDGAQAPVFQAFETGQYSCNISIESGCSAISNAIMVTVDVAPPVQFEPEGPYSICNGETLDICVELSGVAEIYWFNGVSQPCITVANSGDISVTVTDDIGCTSDMSTELVVHDNPLVDLGDDIQFIAGKDIILDAGGDGLTYFWSTGETTSSIVVSTMGLYSVTVTNEFGCIATDEVEVLENTSVLDQDAPPGLQLYPNPAGEILYLLYEDPVPGVTYISDAFGRTVWSGEAIPVSEGVWKVSLAHLIPGWYVVRARDQNKILFRL